MPAGLRPKIVKRAAILFGLGLLGAYFPFYTLVLERARLPGVLQRIAVVYLCAAFAFLYLKPKGRAILAFVLLAGYWAAMKLVPVPGFGAGDLSPQGNLAFWLDHQLLGAHTWRNSPGPGDPEGILSSLPAIVTALFGIFCGELLRRASLDFAAAGQAQGNGPLRARCDPGGPGGASLLPAQQKPVVAFLRALHHRPRPLLPGRGALPDRSRKASAWARPFEIFGTNSILAFVGSGLLASCCWWFSAGRTATRSPCTAGSTPHLRRRPAGLRGVAGLGADARPPVAGDPRRPRPQGHPSQGLRLISWPP